MQRTRLPQAARQESSEAWLDPPAARLRQMRDLCQICGLRTLYMGLRVPAQPFRGKPAPTWLVAYPSKPGRSHDEPNDLAAARGRRFPHGGRRPARAPDRRTGGAGPTQAANDGDLEKFLAQYAPGIPKYRFPGELASEGIEHNREVYTRAFATYPDLEVEILELMTLEDIVVVHDRVTGRADGKTADEVTVYEVKDGLITNIVYVKQSVK